MPGRRVRPAPCLRSFAADLHGSRLTPRGRVAATVAWLALVAAAAVPIGWPDVPAAPASGHTAIVVVEPGDTMWQLARSIEPTGDPRDVIDEIVRLNDMPAGGGRIQPGDVLVVPGGVATR
ncbi:MAG: LysM peptidoglycan-binding domain-containing protein [Jiangellaceae bacterium]|nr:LysM peptidoglycan-binding domain-containing protein [Jiangellaceae bacterium]